MIKFDTRYKVYLDWEISGDLNMVWDDDDNANWVQVYPYSGGLKKSIVADELFSRFSWEEITFRNEPQRYAVASNDAFQIYNIINNLEIDQEIRIKVIIPNEMTDIDDPIVVRGYFGTNDCIFDNDLNTKILKVTPTVLDKYTDVLENWETEVDVVGTTESKTARWNVIDDVEIIDSSRNMPIKLVSSSFDETRTPSGGDGTDNIYSFFLNSSQLYTVTASLTVDGSVELNNGASIGFYLNVYNSSGVLLNEGDDSGLGLILYKLTNTSGSSAIYTITNNFNGDTTFPIGSYAILYVSISETSDTIFSSIDFNINATTSVFSTNNLSINIIPEYLKTITVLNETLYGYANPEDSDVPSLDEYFETNGEPKDLLLEDNSLAPHSTRVFINPWTKPGNASVSIDGLFLPNITTALENCSDGLNSGYELSEVTIFKDITTNKPNIFAHKHRYIYMTCKYSRFEAWMEDDVTPPVEDAGWLAHPTITNNGLVLWTLLPYGGSTSWDIDSGVTIQDGETSGFSYSQKITSRRAYPDSDTSVTVQSRELYDILKTIFNGTSLSLVNSDVISCFFFNDSDSIITTVPGENYFLKHINTGDASNFLNNIACVHSYQFKSQSSDSSDSELKISLKDILEQLKKLFNYQIFWFINDNGNLQIEHIYYLDINKLSLDLSSGTYYTNNKNLLDNIQRWSYDKSKMFSLIKFKMTNSGYSDFNNNTVKYKKIVSNKRGTDISNEYNIDLLTTDIRFCIEYPQDLTNGLILANHDGSYNLINGFVPIAQVDWENGNLSLSNLLNRFAYEGVFLSGYINDTAKEFSVAMRSKKADTITVKGIYNYDFFKTSIGLGMIESVQYNLDNETTEITLRYRFGSDTETDIFELMVAIEGDYVGATDILYDLGEI